MTKLRGSRLKDVRLRERRRITAGIEHHGWPSWSPDGQLLCSALGTGHSSMWLVTDRKGRVARLIEGPVDGGASFGPDHALAYGRQVGATAEIWLMPSIDGAPYRLLGGDGRLYRDPAFSPDGSTLAYLADDGPAAVDGTLRLWLLDLAKNETTLLLSELSWGPVSPEPVRISRPRWSTDAQYLFFEGSKGLGNSMSSKHFFNNQNKFYNGKENPPPITAVWKHSMPGTNQPHHHCFFAKHHWFERAALRHWQFHSDSRQCLGQCPISSVFHQLVVYQGDWYPNVYHRTIFRWESFPG